MTVCLIAPWTATNSGAGGGGSDVTPDAVNWANITTSPAGLGFGHNATQAITGIDTTIQVKAAWTSTSSSPAKGVWFKNGAMVGSYAPTPVTVSARSGDDLAFYMNCVTSSTSGNYDSGTVTVTNESDSSTSLDTFTFTLQYVYGHSGGFV